tara:strand:- start:1337 stop:2287 length:951 start_codon:yes stop_codon:yes gene_type:complete
MHRINLVAESAFQPSEYCKGTTDVILNQKNFSNEVIIAPHHNESHAGFDLMRAKIYCEKKNTKLVVYGSLNQLPFFSVFADTVICTPKTTFASMWTKHNNATRIGTNISTIARHPNFMGDSSRFSFLKSSLAENAKSISDEEVLERFADIDITMRQESYNLFNQLNLNKDVIHFEVKSDHSVFEEHADSMLDTLPKLKWPAQGFDHKFQRGLVEMVGDHFMSLQTLGFLLNGWCFAGLGGAINIFSILQVPSLFLADRTAEPLMAEFSIQRYGKSPLVVQAMPRDSVISANFMRGVDHMNDFLDNYRKPETKISGP